MATKQDAKNALIEVVGEKTVKAVKNTDNKGEFIVELITPLTEEQWDAFVETEWYLSNSAVGAMTFKMRDMNEVIKTEIADDTQALETTQEVEIVDEQGDEPSNTLTQEDLAELRLDRFASRGLPELEDETPGQEGSMAEVVKTVIMRHLDSADPKKPCTHPVTARVEGVEIRCKICGEVVEKLNGNGHEDVASLKAQNAALLDRVMQLEQRLELTQRHVASLTADSNQMIEDAWDIELMPEQCKQRRAEGWAPAHRQFVLNGEGVIVPCIFWQRWVDTTPASGEAAQDAGDTIKADEFPEQVPIVEATGPVITITALPEEEPDAPQAEPAPEPKPVFEIGQRVLYSPPPEVWGGKKRLPAYEAAIQEPGDDAVHILVDLPDGKQEARWAYFCDLKPIPESMPALNADASGEDAPKVTEETCEPVKFTPLTPAELERMKSGRALVVSPFQKQQWLVGKARAAGQKP